MVNYAQKSLQETSRIRSINVLHIAVETIEQPYSNLLNARQPSEKIVAVRGGGSIGLAGTRIEHYSFKIKLDQWYKPDKTLSEHTEEARLKGRLEGR